MQIYPSKKIWVLNDYKPESLYTTFFLMKFKCNEVVLCTMHLKSKNLNLVSPCFVPTAHLRLIVGLDIIIKVYHLELDPIVSSLDAIL